METQITKQSSLPLEQPSITQSCFPLDHQMFTQYRRLFSAVKNVEDALRLFFYENLNYFKNHQSLEHVCGFLKIEPLKRQVEKEQSSFNLELYSTIVFQLGFIQGEIRFLTNEEAVKEQIEDIWYLVHQAFKELDRSNLNPMKKCLKPEHEVFEEFLRIQMR